MQIKIVPNKNWKEASQFMLDLPARLEWFQFEFGKRIANMYRQMILDDTSSSKVRIPDYKKRLVVAEMRDQGEKYWFAVTVKSVPYKSTDLTSDTTILKVVSRFPNERKNDPISAILQEYGPWTVDTIPYIPSNRWAVVVAQKASKQHVESVRQTIKNKLREIQTDMHIYGIEFELRVKVAQSLKIVEDLEKVINEMEFGFGPRYNPSWTKSMRRLTTAGIRELLSQRDLIASLTDPNFKKYRVKVHAKAKFNSQEARDFEKFQRRLLRTV